jgi:hypothetical protein
MEPMKTKTLAEIYIKQGHLREACDILTDLSGKDPSNQELRQRLTELRKRLDVTQSSDPTQHRSLPRSPPHSPPRSNEERLQILEGWLSNIQKRRKT